MTNNLSDDKVQRDLAFFIKILFVQAKVLESDDASYVFVNYEQVTTMLHATVYFYQPFFSLNTLPAAGFQTQAC